MDDSSSSTFGPLLSAILDHLTVGFVVLMLGRSILSMISSQTSPPPATTTGGSTFSAILLESLILSRALWLFYDQPLPATSNDSPFALHLDPLFGPHLYPVLFPLSIVWIILRRVLSLFSQMSPATTTTNPTFEWPLLSAILDLVTQFLVLEIAFERVSWHSLVPTLRMVGTLGIGLIISGRLLLKAWRKGTAAPSVLLGPTPLGDGGQPHLEDPNSTPTGGGGGGGEEEVNEEVLGTSGGEEEVNEDAIGTSGVGGGIGGEEEVNEDALGTSGVGSTLPWVPGLPEIVGREDIFSEILRHLRDDQVGMVFICGPPGVGKTTLLKLIHHKFRRTDTRDFDVVAWVTMSKWSTAMEVQRQVGERLGLSLFAEGPDFVRETQARTLQRLLSRRRFLLLMDEFPEGAPEAAEHFLKEVGVPTPEGRPAGSNKSKIIACTTERCAGILDKQMGCAVRVVLVTGLDVPASQRLFLDKAYPLRARLRLHISFSSGSMPMELAAVPDIIDKCHGLPLALSVLGGLAARKDGELEQVFFSRPSSAEDGGVTDQQALRQILNYGWRKLVDDRERSLMLHCSLFPENHEIPVSDLGEYYYHIDESNSAAALGFILNELQQVGLIEKVDKAAREEKRVKIHRAVRELALDAADGMNLVHAGQGLKVWPPSSSSMGIWASKKASPMRISLMYNHIEELPTAGTDSELHKLFLPQLVTLMLNNNPLARVPDDFFLCMPKLRVLDLSWTRIEDLPDTIGSLRGLRYLNLSHTPIRSLPQGLRGLRNLRQLCLNHTDRLRTIPRAAISSLSTLRRLDLLSTAYRWSEEADDDDGRTGANLDDLDRLATLKEVSLTIKSLSSLRRLKSLQGLQRAARSLLLDQIQGLSTESLLDHGLSVKFDSSEFESAGSFLKKIDMTCITPSQVESSQVITSEREREIERRDYIRQGRWGQSQFRNIVANQERSDPIKVSDYLQTRWEKMRIKEEGALFSSGPHISSFSKREYPSKIVTNVGLSSTVSVTQQHRRLVLRQLRELHINEAPELGSLALHELVRNVLQVVSLDHLPRASISFGGLSHLRRLHAVGCHGLVDLEGAHDLVSLECLELRICHRLQVLSPRRVVNNDSTVVDDDYYYFPKLEKMVLWGLPSLRSILVRSPLQLPSLKYIEVYHCPELKKLPLGRWSANLIEEIHGSREWWDGLEWDDQATKSALDPYFSDPRRHMEELEEETDEEYLVESTDEECINLESKASAAN